MQITATQISTREAPRKVRLVADVVRKLSPEAAVKQLVIVERRAGEVILKVLSSALANAAHNFNLSPAELRIVSIIVNEGPRFKRFQPVSRGRAHTIIKRTSHVTVILELLADQKKATSTVKTTSKFEDKKPADDKKAQPITKKSDVIKKKTANKEKKPVKV